jgi:hypothetical protein
MNIPSNMPITAAVYGPKAAVRKAKPVDPAKPVRKPRTTSIGESITPHAAAALVALRDELEAAQPKKRRKRAPKKS